MFFTFSYSNGLCCFSSLNPMFFLVLPCSIILHFMLFYCYYCYVTLCYYYCVLSSYSFIQSFDLWLQVLIFSFPPCHLMASHRFIVFVSLTSFFVLFIVINIFSFFVPYIFYRLLFVLFLRDLFFFFFFF